MSKQPTPPTGSARGGNGLRQPLLWGALAYAAGVYVGRECWRPPSWWTAAALVLLIAAACLLHQRSRLAKPAGLGALCFLGALMVQVRGPSLAGSGILVFADGREISVTAHVIREGTWVEHGPHEFKQVIDLETEALRDGDTLHEVRSGIRIGVFRKRDDSGALFRYGQRLSFPAKLLPPHNFRNPGSFDYRAYLADNGIEALGSTTDDRIEILSGFVGNSFARWRLRIHRSVISHVHRLWAAQEAALVDAMVIGEDAFLSREIRAEFQRTGTYHVLVVSGMNVGILAFVIFWVLRRFHLGDNFASILTVLVCIFYAFLTDVGAPIWRATLMLIFYLGVRFLYRDRSMLNAIGAAVLGLLLVDPNALFGASFQLTFLCVLLIAAIAVPILERTLQPYLRGLRHLDRTAVDSALNPAIAQFRLDLRMIAGRFHRLLGRRVPLLLLAALGRASLGLAELLWISATMQIGLALPMAYYFHRATFVGLPANILVVPLTEIMMPAAIAAFLLSYLSLPIAKLPALIAFYSLRLITGGLSWFGGFRIADSRVATPTNVMVLIALAVLVLAMLLVHKKAIFAAASLLAVVIATFWICVIPHRPQIRANTLEITAIDVGQGDSLFLALPDGGTMLVDSGGIPLWMHSEFDIGEQVVAPYLWSRGISHLDRVVVTHPHADHIGGMASIIANFHPRELWIGAGASNQELDALLHVATAFGVKIVSHKTGDDVLLGRTRIRILAPDGESVPNTRRQNDDTLAMQIIYGANAALLLGDAEKGTEERIVQQAPRVDLLKVAHHGSATSTLPELLAAAQPRLAVISVGAHNAYRHPREVVLDRLQQAEAATYRTDLNGAITFYLDGTTVQATATNLP